jgi:UDP-3-O-[3-hydroxymyristoyl] glucosamine N-acyltransferase
MVLIPPTSSFELSAAVAATAVHGSGEHIITELGEPLEVGSGGAAFLISEKFLADIPRTRAGVLVVQSSLAERVSGRIPPTVRLWIECEDAYLGLANFSKTVRDKDPISDWYFGQASGLNIDPSARIAATARVGTSVTIGARAEVGEETIVIGNAVIGPEARIGANCVIYPGVVIYPRTCVGDRVRVHANAVLGCDGFGYARGKNGSVKIYHLGKVVIGNDVEIGAGTMIDRGTLKDTIIEDGVKIDNLVQIGHNGHIKAHAHLCAQVGLAGNVTVGRGVILAGKVGVADKVTIGDGAVVAAMSGVSKSVKPGELVAGQPPARPRREWWKLVALVARLPELFRRVEKLEAKEAVLSTSPDVASAP